MKQSIVPIKDYLLWTFNGQVWLRTDPFILEGVLNNYKRHGDFVELIEAKEGEDYVLVGDKKIGNVRII